MYDAAFMRGFQAIRNLPGDLQCFVHRKGAPLHALGQRFAFDKLHHNANGVARLFKTVNVRNVRMIQ